MSKTAHERLLELGWVIDKTTDTKKLANVEFYYKNNTVLIIDKKLKVVKIQVLYGWIDLQLAEVLVDYLRELENE